MLDFGSRLRRLRPEWWQFNLSYEELISRLNEVKKEFGMRRALSRRSLHGETRTFAEILDQDVEKIVLFYLRYQGELATRLWAMRERQIMKMQEVTLSIEQIETLWQRYRDLSQEVLDLLEYLDLNVIGLQKILKRHDKQFDMQMTSIYFGSRLGEKKHSQLVQLYHQEGMQAIIGTIRRGFEDLYEAKCTLLEEGAGDGYTYAMESGIAGMGHRQDTATRDGYRALNRDDSGGGFYIGKSSAGSGDLRVAAHKKCIPRITYSARKMSVSNFQLLAAGSDAATARQNRIKASRSQTLIAQVATPAFGTTTPWHGHGHGYGHGDSHGSSYSTEEDRSASSPNPLRSISRTISSSFLALLHGKEEEPEVETRPRSISDVEPILKKITEVSARVLETQQDTLSENMTRHSALGLEIAVRDMERDDEEDEYDYSSAEEEMDKQAGRPPPPNILAARARKQSRKKSRETSNAGLWLNLLITFLYQCNQYVVAPTSGQYSAMLGMSASMSGLIIGMSPCAALVSALVFSVWTNRSFKQPLIASLIMLTAGNFLYATALQFNSPEFIFLGRMLTGLGGPRGISRRYIADHVSLADRMTASSHFVTAGAMGLAFGPLISSLVSMSGVNFVAGRHGVVLVRYESVTAPGWIMFVLFFSTLIAVLVLFEEPYIPTHDKKDSAAGNSAESVSCLESIVRCLSAALSFVAGRPAARSVPNSAKVPSSGKLKNSTSADYGSIQVQQVVGVDLGYMGGDLPSKGSVVGSGGLTPTQEIVRQAPQRHDSEIDYGLSLSFDPHDGLGINIESYERNSVSYVALAKNGSPIDDDATITRSTSSSSASTAPSTFALAPLDHLRKKSALSAIFEEDEDQRSISSDTFLRGNASQKSVASERSTVLSERSETGRSTPPVNLISPAATAALHVGSASSTTSSLGFPSSIGSSWNDAQNLLQITSNSLSDKSTAAVSGKTATSSGKLESIDSSRDSIGNSVVTSAFSVGSYDSALDNELGMTTASNSASNSLTGPLKLPPLTVPKSDDGDANGNDSSSSSSKEKSKLAELFFPEKMPPAPTMPSPRATIGSPRGTEFNDTVSPRTASSATASQAAEAIVPILPPSDSRKVSFEQTSSSSNKGQRNGASANSASPISGLSSSLPNSLLFNQNNTAVTPTAKSTSPLSPLTTTVVQYTMALPDDDLVAEDEKKYCCHLITLEVAIILFVYLVNKIGQEMVVSSVPTLAKDVFQWDSECAGFFMAAMGALVLPANIVVLQFSKDMEDRSVMQYLNYWTLLSILLLMDTFIVKYTTLQYIIGSVLVFAFLNSLEGVIMSLLSKLVSPELAKGTFNSGLLSTEAGTLGRVIGDAAITAFSESISSTMLINVLFLPVAVGVIICIYISDRYYDRMEV